MPRIKQTVVLIIYQTFSRTNDAIKNIYVKALASARGSEKRKINRKKIRKKSKKIVPVGQI